jgi:tripeptidyl-peptidase I
VTVVGATQINANQSVHDAESAASIAAISPNIPFYSGGGFSNYHKLPGYQKGLVSQYFQQNPSPYPTYQYNGSQQSIGANGGRFNRNGRGFPDVSTIGSNIFTVAGGCFGFDGGTSYSTPIFAGMISRINAERFQAGKKPLGFINPALYANTQMFNDIVSGHSTGCGTDGFAAVKG